MVAPFLKPTQLINALQRRPATMIKTPEQQHAALIVFVGRLMAICFTFTVMAFIYGVLFVDQPMEQAPTDAQLIDLLSTLLVFLLAHLAALSRLTALKPKPNQPE
jgi:hypothetical protein